MIGKRQEWKWEGRKRQQLFGGSTFKFGIRLKLGLLHWRLLAYTTDGGEEVEGFASLSQASPEEGRKISLDEPALYSQKEISIILHLEGRGDHRG